MYNNYSRIKEIIDQYFPTFTNNERKIAIYVKENVENITDLSVSELARECEVSETTVFRFVKKIGFNGYPDFKIQIAKDVALTEESDLVEDSNNIIILTRNKILKQLDRSCYNIELEVMTNACEIIRHSNNVVVMGVGSSGIVATFCEDRFMRLGIFTKAITDPHKQRMICSAMKEDDCVIFVSLTGRSKDIIEAAKIAKDNKCKIIALTSYPASPLAKYADIILNTITKVDYMHSGSLYNSISQMFNIEILSTLYSNIYQNDVESNQTKVQDIMKNLNNEIKE